MEDGASILTVAASLKLAVKQDILERRQTCTIRSNMQENGDFVPQHTHRWQHHLSLRRRYEQLV